MGAFVNAWTWAALDTGRIEDSRGKIWRITVQEVWKSIWFSIALFLGAIELCQKQFLIKLKTRRQCSESMHSNNAPSCSGATWDVFVSCSVHLWGKNIPAVLFSPLLLHRIVMSLAVFLRKLLVVAWWTGILGIWLDDILGSSSAEEDPVEISWSWEELSLRLRAPHSRPSWPSITELQNRMTWTESPWAEHQRVSGHHL